MADQEQKAKENTKEQGQATPESKQVARGSSSGGLLHRPFDPLFMSPRDFFSANPFSLMRRMSEEMDRVFGEFGPGRSGGGTTPWLPAIEVSEQDGKCLIHADLPGMKPEDVKVEMTEDALVIQGERKSDQEQTEGTRRRTERQYGHFYRSIPLPQGVNPDQVRANFQNGVLEITVPLPQAQSNRRQIPVESSSGSASSGSGSSASGSSRAASNQGS